MAEMVRDIPKKSENQPKGNQDNLSNRYAASKPSEVEFSAKLYRSCYSICCVVPHSIIAQYPQFLGKGRVARFKIILGGQK